MFKLLVTAGIIDVNKFSASISCQPTFIDFPSIGPTLIASKKAMPEAPQKPFWKKAVWLLVKVYAGLCALLVTTLVVLTIWDNLTEDHSDQAKLTLNNSYNFYMKYEYPKRGNYFYNVATSLGLYANTNSSIAELEVGHYLGKPDQIFGSTNKGAYVYDYKPYDFSSNNFFVVCSFLDGKLALLGFGDNTVNPTNAVASNHLTMTIGAPRGLQYLTFGGSQPNSRVPSANSK